MFCSSILICPKNFNLRSNCSDWRTMSSKSPIKISLQLDHGSKRFHSLMKTAQNRDVLLSFFVLICSNDYSLYQTTPSSPNMPYAYHQRVFLTRVSKKIGQPKVPVSYLTWDMSLSYSYAAKLSKNQRLLLYVWNSSLSIN